MENQITQDLLDAVVELSERAGQAIMKVYTQDAPIDVAIKGDDSPLTAADLASDQVIKGGLDSLLENTPILSEEGGAIPYRERSKWQRYWLIDPLDGTKEFIRRNGEFTVNIALIENGEPVLGVVHVPVKQVTYTGLRGVGAAKMENGQRQGIQVRPIESDGQTVQVVASRHHGAEAIVSLLQSLEQHFPQLETKSIGSSLKLCLVAEGVADLYPRLALTAEWDTAAAQAVVEAAGGAVLHGEDFSSLRYNTKDCLLNPYFYVVGDAEYNWKSLLPSVKVDSSI